jgi:K+-transporting ATPase ATPase A chain
MKMTSIAILVTPLLVLLGHRLAVMHRGGRRRHRQPRRARLFGDPVRLLVGCQQQRQRLRRTVGEHAFLQHGAGASRCGWAALPSSCRCWRWPARWPPRSGSRPPPARCRRTARCSSVLLIGTVLLVGALNYVPALALGPVVEHQHAVVKKR